MLTSSHHVRRIFLDCTATRRDCLNTGVQRVVRNIVNHAPKIGAELGIECHGVWYDPLRGYIPVDGLELSTRAESASPPSWAPTTMLRGLLATLGLRKLAGAARRRTVDLLLRPMRRLSSAAIQFQPGDVLVLLDRSWSPDFPWPEVRTIQSRGALIAAVVYDLIPLQLPGYCEPSHHEVFARWWQFVRQVPDLLIAISQSVQHDIEAFERRSLAGGPESRSLRTGHFVLGSELDGAGEGGLLRPAIQELRSRSGPLTYLMVGTLAPHKNYEMALDAFDALWSDGAEVRLLLGGRAGWNSQHLVERVRRHTQFGSHLLWFENLTDDELDACYRLSAGLISTSLAEGFNLPLVESLSRGCPVFASDIPVHREVAQDFAAYFPTDQPAELSRLIALHGQLGTLPGVRPPREFHWGDWSDATRGLLKAVHAGAKCTQSPSR